MANRKEIRTRMDSVRDTRKITNAMYLIAATKMRNAKRELDETRPYFDALRTEIKRIFRTVQTVEHRYFYPSGGIPPKDNRTYGCLVMTADKGLAGAYNQNVLREVEKLREEHPNTRFFVVGEYGRQFFRQHKIPFEEDFQYLAQHPTIERAREISGLLLQKFDGGEIAKLFVIYTDLKNGMFAEAKSTRLIPFHRSQFTADKQEKAVQRPFVFEPSVGAVLDHIVPSYITGFVYSALVDSYCCEQNARMMAMSAANRNADEILRKLTQEYNQIRQAAITQEITEISSGAKAQRRKQRAEE